MRKHGTCLKVSTGKGSKNETFAAMVVTCVYSLGGIGTTNIMFSIGAGMLEIVSISTSDADVNTLYWLHDEATGSIP